MLLTTSLLVGAMIGTMVSVDTGALRLQYAHTIYQADRPHYWATDRLDVDAGAPWFGGLSVLRHEPIPPATWAAEYAAPRVGIRTPAWELAWHTDGGFDVRITTQLSPSLRAGFETWRWFGGSWACVPYCQWSGFVISLSE